MPPHKIETGHQDVVHDVVMDYYGKRVATASSDNTIKIIGVSGSSHQQLATLSGHQGPVWQVAWAHPKFGSMLASCGYDGRVIIWKEGSKPDEWVQAHTFAEHKSSVNSIAWAPHELGLCLACGSSDGNISVFTAHSDGGWDTTRIDQAHPVGVTSVSWAPAMAPGALITTGPSGQFEYVQKLASGGCDNTVKVWKLYNGGWRMDCFPALQMHKDWVRDVAWAPNLGLPKSTIASASQDGTVVIWTEAKEGEQWEGRVLHDFRTPVWRLSWSLTGNILAAADGNNNVTLWKEAVDGEWQQVDAVNIEETKQPQGGSTGPRNYGKEASKSFSSKELLEKLKRYGAAGVLSYGLLNTVYYVTTFLLVWFYISPAPGRMGYAAAVQRFLKLMAMVWAGSQVTKIFRAGGALALAPFVDRGLRWFTVKFNFQSEGKAFATIVGLCLTLAALLFFGLTILWA